MGRPTPSRPFRLVRLFQPSPTATALALAYQRLRPARSPRLGGPGAAGARPASATAPAAAGA